MRKTKWAGICAAFVFINPAWANLVWKQTEATLKPKLGDAEGAAIYAFKNNGTSPVQIVQIQPSCGCTTASLEQKTFKPGESGEIRAVFDYGVRLGNQKVSILVKTDEPKSNIYRLEIKADIPALLKLEPIYLKWVENEASTMKAVKIQVDPEGSNTKLMGPGENLYYTAVLKPNGRNEYMLEITPKEPRKNISLRVPIETDHPNPKHKLYAVQVDMR